MAAYYMLLTATGQAKVAAHIAGGAPVELAQMALGDGNGAAIVPTEGRAELYGEVYRQPLGSVTVDPVNHNWLVAETVLAPGVGGWTIREIGLIDTAGDLIAYGNFPASYKPVLAEGSAKELIIRAVFEVASTASVTLTVDPSIVFASQSWVTNQGYATQLWVTGQGYATQAWVNAKSYITSAALATLGYATEAWVTAKGYATQAWVDAKGYATSASNAGTGAGQVFATKTGGNLAFRSIKQGDNVTVSQSGNDIIIAATAGVTDHGALTGLADDDHPHYLTAARGDTRYAPITRRAATTSAAHARITGTDGNDWMIQKGAATAPASGTYSTATSVVFPFPFKPGTSPSVQLTPIMGSTSGGPIVPVLSTAPTATGFSALFDIAEGSGDSASISAAINFQWIAQGIVDDSGWLSGAAITYSAAAGTPATATVSVAAGTYTNGVASKAYDASTAALTGTGGSTVTYYLYYTDPTFTGGAKTLQTTTDAAVPFASAGNIVVGQVAVAYPATGTGGGGGDTGGGGGGGGSCPSVDAFVIGRDGLLRAGDVQVGDALLLCDPDSGAECFGVVTYSAPVITDGCRIAFGSGTLTCSTTAPIPTDIGYLPAPQTVGRSVSTRTLDGDRTSATVADAPALGAITVQHITVGDRCFWVGDDGVTFLLHHNFKAPPGMGPEEV